MSLIGSDHFPELHHGSTQGKYVVQLKAVCYAHYTKGIYKLWRFWFEDKMDAKCFIDVYKLIVEAKLLHLGEESEEEESAESSRDNSDGSQKDENVEDHEIVVNNIDDSELSLDDFANTQDNWPANPSMPFGTF